MQDERNTIKGFKLGEGDEFPCYILRLWIEALSFLPNPFCRFYFFDVKSILKVAFIINPLLC